MRYFGKVTSHHVAGLRYCLPGSLPGRHRGRGENDYGPAVALGVGLLGSGGSAWSCGTYLDSGLK